MMKIKKSLFFVMIILCFCLTNCQSSNNNESSFLQSSSESVFSNTIPSHDEQLTNKLNGMLNDHFAKIDLDIGLSSSDILQCLDIENLEYLSFYDLFLVSLQDNNEEKYACCYLSLEIKEILDEILFIGAFDDYYRTWTGINDYVIKYYIAAKDNKIDTVKYPIIWKEYENKNEIEVIYEGWFLACFAKNLQLDIYDMQSQKSEIKELYMDVTFSCSEVDIMDKVRKIYITYPSMYETNAYDILKNVTEGFLLLNIYQYPILSSADHFQILINFWSIEYRTFENEIYLNSKRDSESYLEKYDNFIEIDGIKYYKLSDVVENSNSK